jgi:transcriptional regulator with XRE-family HTH domain
VASRKSAETARMGRQLAGLRKERGLTQAQLAERLGLSLEGYRMYEKGYTRVRADNLPRWARALNLPAPALAARLDIPLGVEPDASALAREVAALLGPDEADEIDAIVRELEPLPTAARRRALDMMRVSVRLVSTDARADGPRP